jgi:hypothetical protein
LVSREIIKVGWPFVYFFRFFFFFFFFIVVVCIRQFFFSSRCLFLSLTCSVAALQC